MLGVFRNTLTANDNYPVQDCRNLPFAIQMHLSLKRKIFSYFFVLFLQWTSNYEQFEKKDDRHTYFTWESRHCERVG